MSAFRGLGGSVQQESEYPDSVGSYTNITLLLPSSEFLDSHLTTQKFNLLTSRIASEAQRDSSAMITIAVLTMFFLPATFVCVGLSVAFPPPSRPLLLTRSSLKSFFGTSFFSDSADRFHASPQIWIYWAVAIPLTGLVFAVWLVLKTRRDAKRARDPDEEGAGHSF